jgi:GTPase
VSPRAHRSGVVAILGRPNAGKSSLLNAVIGQKIAIVTAKPQTTRSRILGVRTQPGAQILFLDTPGLHRGGAALNTALNDQVEDAVRACNLALVLADRAEGWGEDHAALWAALAARGARAFAVRTKIDRIGSGGRPWPPAGIGPAYTISSQTGEGIPRLLEDIVSALPEAPARYPEDDLSDRPLRFLVAELIREAAFELLEREVPYSTAVEVTDYDESRPELVYIRAHLLVERESQKQIVIGRAGAMVKAIGSRARTEIEALLDAHVHLELRVKLEPRWAKRPERIRALGYV